MNKRTNERTFVN